MATKRWGARARARIMARSRERAPKTEGKDTRIKREDANVERELEDTKISKVRQEDTKDAKVNRHEPVTVEEAMEAYMKRRGSESVLSIGR